MQGVILGTAGYMSPEQARGKPVDRRADVWAFGCVLLEMLGGRQVFGGETISDTLAAVLKSEPDWESLPKDTPHSVRHLLKRCLDKDAKQRLRDVGEARILLDRVIHGDIEVAGIQFVSQFSVIGMHDLAEGLGQLAGFGLGPTGQQFTQDRPAGRRNGTTGGLD